MKKIIKRILLLVATLFLMIPLITPVVAEEVTVTIHYKRHDGDYEGWNLWVWPEGQEGQEIEFNHEDEFGKIAQFNIDGSNDIGFIVKKVDGDNIWAEKDTDEDRYIDTFKQDGSAEIWLMENDPDISYEELDGTIADKFKDVQITDMKVIKLTTTTPFTQDEANNIAVNQGEIEKVVQGTPTTASIYLKEDLDLTKEVIVHLEKYGSETARLGQVLHSKSFNDRYAYDGPLGFEYTPDKTVFRLWAPTAIQVDLKLENKLVPMNKEDKGLWVVEVEGDTLNQNYTYELEFLNDLKTSSVDPYSFAVTANSEQSVIVTDELLTPEGFDPSERMPSFSDYSDAIIYEAHVRDMTIHPDNGITNKGKFLGLTEKGTTTTQGNPSGLDYIKSLGVTHVQFLPMYDFASIDETLDLSYGQVYNWGYDPLNYNVPEGTYSSDPQDPLSRVHEMKQMIQAFHDEGLYVIMDVVYNHVADVNRSPFHKTVPGYYFRYDNLGKLKNGTGVGNETASEQPMFRRYMVESILYWVNEYNIDGFRFDLMGIHDIETMQLIREEVNKIDPSIIILGEGWDMGTMASNLKANQKNGHHLPKIAFFNDSFRDAVKGSVFEAKEPGFVNGAKNKERLLYNNMIGAQNLDESLGSYTSANQVVQYVEAHDNLTLFDKLSATNSVDSDETREKRHNLATTMVFLSQGMPFIHAGQEILRTKDGDPNSYISPDDINVFDYDRVNEYPNSLELFKHLVSLRQEYPLLRINDYETIASNTELIVSENQLIAYEIDDNAQQLVIAYNGSSEPKQIEFTERDYTQLLMGNQLDEIELGSLHSFELAPYTAVLLMAGSVNTGFNYPLIIGGLLLLLLLIGWFMVKRRR